MWVRFLGGQNDPGENGGIDAAQDPGGPTSLPIPCLVPHESACVSLLYLMVEAGLLSGQSGADFSVPEGGTARVSAGRTWNGLLGSRGRGIGESVSSLSHGERS